VEQLVKTAFEAKSPRDQVVNFLERGYIPLKWQWNFHSLAREADKPNGPTEIGVGGARGPGKSHSVLAQVTIDDLQRKGGLKALFLRQTGISARESFEDLVDKLLRGKIAYQFNKAQNILFFPNKSRVVLGGFKDERDIDKYIGIEYDLMAIEELNQLTEDKTLKLKGSLRSSKSDWRARLYASFNPGGIGHQYVKKNFIDERPKRTEFVPATYKDNPYLSQEYVDYLVTLPGELGKAWREGEFDLFEGQFFKEWRRRIHVCEPFQIPTSWIKIICLDYGYVNPSAVYWLAISPEGIVYVYRELYETELTYKRLAEKVISLTNEDISEIILPPDIWAKKGESDLSGAEIIQNVFEQKRWGHIPIKQANNDRMNGWGVMREYLKPFMLEGKIIARLQVFSTCFNLIRTLPAQIFDTHKVEDLNTKGEDHAVDAIRYGLMSKPETDSDQEQLESLRVQANRLQAEKDSQELL